MLIGHVADDVHHFGLIGAGAALVDDCQLGIVETLGQSPCAHHAADIGRHHDRVIEMLGTDVLQHDRRGIDVIQRLVEEALNLIGVQIDGQDPIDAGLGDHVGHYLGRDRYPGRTRSAILPGIAEIRDYRGDPHGRGTQQRVGHDQQFHQVIVGR